MLTDSVLDALGPTRRHWLRLVEFAQSQYGVEGERMPERGEIGWSLRFRRSGKSLFTLIPRVGGFTALVVVGPSAWEAAETLDLAPQTRVAWDAAHPYHDGRWLWLDVTSERVAHDVERLVTLKSAPPKRRRVVVAT